MNKATTTFAEALASHLEARSLTQTHLALMMGVTPARVNHLLSGHRRPGEEVMAQVAEALEARIEYIPNRGWNIEY